MWRGCGITIVCIKCASLVSFRPISNFFFSFFLESVSFLFLWGKNIYTVRIWSNRVHSPRPLVSYRIYPCSELIRTMPWGWVANIVTVQGQTGISSLRHEENVCTDLWGPWWADFEGSRNTNKRWADRKLCFSKSRAPIEPTRSIHQIFLEGLWSVRHWQREKRVRVYCVGTLAWHSNSYGNPKRGLHTFGVKDGERPPDVLKVFDQLRWLYERAWWFWLLRSHVLGLARNCSYMSFPAGGLVDFTRATWAPTYDYKHGHGSTTDREFNSFRQVFLRWTF